MEAIAVRVASLTPSNTEIVAFLDELDALVARDQFSDWPPSVEQVPSLGPDLQIDVDELAELDPDVVLASESVPGMERVNERVDAAGLRYVTLSPSSLAEVQADVRHVADLLGVPERGQRLADAMEAGLATVEAAVDGADPVDVYWEWWPTPPITPGSGGWTDEVIRRAGGRNVFTDRGPHSVEVTLDEVEAADPEVVGLCWQGTLHAKQSRERFRSRDEGAWGKLSAVRKKGIHPFPEALYGRPGPRLVEGTRRLAATLHPDRRERLPEPYAWLPDELKGKLPLGEP